MRIRHTIIGAICAVAGLTGCTTTVEDEPTPATESATPPEATTSPAATTSALPEVTFNACEAIDDAFLRRFEFDPASREPDEISIGREYGQGCGYMSYSRSLSVFAQNTPWDNIQFETPPQPLTVNGRETRLAPQHLSDNSCVVLLRTDFGEVIIEQTARRGGDVDPNMDPCDNIMEIAEAVEPLIDGN